MRLWITGAKGMLGREVSAIASATGHDVLATDRELDIANASELAAWTEGKTIDAVLNCAAYTAVDRAETEETVAHRVNADGPASLAELAARRNIPFAHISTDYVLDGIPGVPLAEDAPRSPINAYGRTKSEGEERAIAAFDGTMVVRTAWLYGLQGPNFVKTMLRLMREKPSLRVVDDQVGSPTWAADLALTLLRMLVHAHSCRVAGGRWPSGVFHFSGAGEVSWHGFAMEIQKKALALGLLAAEVPIAAVGSDEYPAPARRPAWSVLSKQRILKEYRILPAPWQESLQRYLEQESAIVR